MTRLVKDPVLNKPNCYVLIEEDDEDEEDELERLVDGVPVGCRACGGPYPHCTSSCNLWDN